MPSTFETAVTATSLVRSVSSLSSCVESQQAVVGRSGICRSTAPRALGQLLPGDEVRVVLHLGQQDFVAGRMFASPQLRATRLMPSVVP